MRRPEPVVLEGHGVRLEPLSRAHATDLLVAAGRSGGTTCDAIGERPRGNCDKVDVSRSPYTVIATVRGIGVAVITSTCGGCAALARRPF